MKLKILIGSLLIIIIGVAVFYFVSPNNKNNTTIVTPIINTSPQAAARDGFPTLNQLESLTNYTSTNSVSNTITYTQYVYNPNNYKTVTGNIVTIVNGGTSYSKVGNLNTITTNKVNNKTDLISYSEQINGLINDPVVKVKKLGNCSYASQEGQSWEVYFNQIKAYDQAYFACTDLNKGYLLALNEGASLGSNNTTLSASFKILGINDVSSPFNPSQL